MHDYYARYLPQMALAVFVPLLIVIAIFPVNWVAALILLGTAPLIPLFMALVGMGAADANRRNFLALGRLSGHFLDRLRGMETLRIFGRGEAETENIRLASQDFRQRTMEVLRLAFCPPAYWNSSPRCRLPWWRSTLASPTSARWISAITARR
jgi:ATP-binding cassette subfamily C protein CydD